MLARLLVVTLALSWPVSSLAGNTATTTTSATATASSCSLELSASSTSQWQVACADRSLVSVFDPSQLSVVKIGTYSAVGFEPANVKTPNEVHVPTTLTRVSGLISTSIASFSLQGAEGNSVQIDAASFSKMTALRSLTITKSNITIDGPLDVNPTLSEITIQHTGLVDFKVKILKGVHLNITKLDLRYNRLRRLPLAIFASKRLIEANLMDNEFPGLQLSKLKLRRLVRLIAAKRLLLGAVADFTDSCSDGETKKIRIGRKTVTVCQLASEDDDDLVSDDGDDGSTDAGSDGSDDMTSNDASANSATSSSDAGQTDHTNSKVSTLPPSPAVTTAAPKSSAPSVSHSLARCLAIGTLSVDTKRQDDPSGARFINTFYFAF